MCQRFCNRVVDQGGYLNLRIPRITPELYKSYAFWYLQTIELCFFFDGNLEKCFGLIFFSGFDRPLATEIEGKRQYIVPE